jgi:catechol 2,3-dioxygenase-like lactoylglutathione lyase family enzyme
MGVVHHSAICVRDIEESLRFWRDGLGFRVTMDQRFAGDWVTLLHGPTTSLRSVFLGDPDHPDAGFVELVDLGHIPDSRVDPDGPATVGFLLLSIMTNLSVALGRLTELGLGGVPRRVEVSGVSMAVVKDPDGVLVELIDAGAEANLRRINRTESAVRER